MIKYCDLIFRNTETGSFETPPNFVTSPIESTEDYNYEIIQVSLKDGFKGRIDINSEEIEAFISKYSKFEYLVEFDNNENPLRRYLGGVK